MFFFNHTSTNMVLHHPSILSFYNGKLLVSTVSGLQFIPLKHPLIRMGILIGAAASSPLASYLYYQRATKWFSAIPEECHEALAIFLERRGTPELIVANNNLTGSQSDRQ